MNVTTCCSAWQRFSTGIPCSCGYINHWWITVLATVPSEGLKITGVQFRLATLPSMRKIIWWYHALKGEKCTNLFLSFLINIVCRYFNDFPLICWQNGALPILVPQRHINTAFIPNFDYNHLLTSPVWENYFFFSIFFCPVAGLKWPRPQVLLECAAGVKYKKWCMTHNTLLWYYS